MKSILFFFLCIYFPNLFTAQTVYHVNFAVQGGLFNGSNWDNAFSDLQAAITIALEGDAIWVAQGIYYPTSSTDRSVSFALKQGVKIYGGFTGVETELGQRNWLQRKTVLSGDIGLPNHKGDNSYHVLYCSGVDSTTVLDGFEITRGETDYNTANYTDAFGGGLLLEPGLTMYNTSPVIQNCTFFQNSAFAGAGIYCNWNVGDNLINPILRHCIFEFNRSLSVAGAIYKKGPMPENQTYVIDHCIFKDNSSRTAEGGAINFVAFSGHTIFNRCIFERDSAFQGGAINFSEFAYPEQGAEIRMDSCVFVGNHSFEGGGFSYVEPNGSSGFLNLNLEGCHFERNQALSGSGGAFFYTGFNSVNVRATIFNTIFLDNKSASGSSIALGAHQNYFQIKNCKFVHNTGSDLVPDAPIFALLVSGHTLNGSIENCLFSKNSNGVTISTQENGTANSYISQCTFYQNGRDILVKTWYPAFDTSSVYGNHAYVANCVFYEPQSDLLTLFRNYNMNFPNMYGYHIDYSMVNIIEEPFIYGWSEAYGDHMFFKVTTPLFSDPQNGNYSLQACSPGVNTGDNQVAINAGLLFDLNGAPRIYKDTVDMGAYETQNSCFSSVSSPMPISVPISLSPNPVGPGRFFMLVFPEGVHGTISWQLEDFSGKRLAEGLNFISDVDPIRLPAPAARGVYLLRVQGRGFRFHGKLLVLD